MIGAAGQMYAVQVPENGGFSETPSKFGGVQTGISGTRTVDSQGERSDYTLSWEDLSEDDCSVLRQFYSQVRSSGKPIRMFLPHRKNLLTASASSARSVARPRESTINYAPLAGNAVVSTPEVYRTSLDATYPLTPRLTRMVKIVNSTLSNDFVYPEGNPDVVTGTPWSRIPLIEGRQYTCSVLYAKDPVGAGTCNLRNVWRNEDGGNTGAPAGSNVALSTLDWDWQSFTFTVPTGFPGFCPLIESGPSSTLYIGAMQVEEGPVRTPWVMGNGVPVIAFTSLQFTDTLWPLRNASMTAIEL